MCGGHSVRKSYWNRKFEELLDCTRKAKLPHNGLSRETLMGSQNHSADRTMYPDICRGRKAPSGWVDQNCSSITLFVCGKTRSWPTPDAAATDGKAWSCVSAGGRCRGGDGDGTDMELRVICPYHQIFEKLMSVSVELQPLRPQHTTDILHRHVQPHTKHETTRPAEWGPLRAMRCTAASASATNT